MICVFFFVVILLFDTIFKSLLFGIHRTKIEYSFDGPTIVYCPTKKATENVAKELCGKRHVTLNHFLPAFPRSC